MLNPVRTAASLAVILAVVGCSDQRDAAAPAAASATAAAASATSAPAASATSAATASATAAIPAQWVVLEDFERDTLWSLDSANDYADLSFTSDATLGQTALQVAYQDDGRDKVILRKEVALDFSAVDACTLDVFSSNVAPASAAPAASATPATTASTAPAPVVGPAVALAFLSHQGTWFETAAAPVKTGWNRALSFRLAADGFKTGTDIGKWTAESKAIDRLMICIIPPAGRGATAIIDRLMVHAAGPVWREDAAVMSAVTEIDAHAPIPVYGRAEATVAAVFPAPALMSDDGPSPPPLRRMSALIARVQPPAGKAFTMRGFCTGMTVADGKATLTYGLRLSPGQPGLWRYQLGIEGGRATVWAPEASFTCGGGEALGPIGIDAQDPRWFARAGSAAPSGTAAAADADVPGEDDPAPAVRGTWFYPVGENLAWAGEYAPYIDSIAKGGGNWVRTWSCPWNDELGADHRLDTIDFHSADQLDGLFAAAEKRGVAVQLCLFYHGLLGGDWGRNPFNAANGGPCKDARDFWTNGDAKAGVKRLLDYAVARWGYSSQLFAWEFFNETDFTPRNQDDDIIAWHREMAAYLRSIDVHHHLITTSTGMPEDLPGLWRLEDLDLAEVHGYGPDQPTLLDRAAAAAHTARMPLMVAEFGRGWMAKDDQVDPQGRLMRQTRWCALMRGLPAGAMPWWWDTHIAANGLAADCAAIPAFLQGEDFRGRDLQPISGELGRDAHSAVRVDALVGAGGIYGYVYAPDLVATPQAAALAPLVTKGGRIHFDHVAAGPWTWTIHDAKTGAVVGTGQGTADARGLDVIPGEQSGDFAFKAKPAKAGAVTVGP